MDLNELIGHTTAIGVATRESGEIIGNSLKTIYSRVNTLPKAQRAIEKLGVALTLPNGDNRKVSDILDDVAKEWPKLNNAQKQHTAIAIAGTYQLNRFLALMNNYKMGLDATKTAQHSYNSAVKENEKFMQSLQAKLNLLKSTFQQLSVALGKAGFYGAIKFTLDALNTFGQGLTAIVTALGKWSFAVPAAAAALGVFALQFRKTKAEMTIFRTQMAMSVAETAGLNTAFARQALAMQTTASTSAVLGGAFTTLRNAAIGMTTALMTNPLTWITVAITGVVMLAGHLKKLKAEHDALMKKAEDNTKAFKDFKAEIAKGDVSQTSIDTFSAKADVAANMIGKLEKAQRKNKEAQEQAARAYASLNTAYNYGAVNISNYTNWQDSLSKKTKQELADIGIKYDSYKSFGSLMAAVKKRQNEYQSAVEDAEAALKKQREEAILPTADAYYDLSVKIDDNATAMENAIGITDKLVSQMKEQKGIIELLSGVKNRDSVQTKLLDNAYSFWAKILGVTEGYLKKHPELMNKQIKKTEELTDLSKKLADGTATNEEKKRAQYLLTAENAEKAAKREAIAEEQAAKRRAEAAEKEAKRKAAAFSEFRQNMILNKTMNLGMTEAEVKNATLRGDFNQKAADKIAASFRGEIAQTNSAKNAYDKMRNFQNKVNSSRSKNQTDTSNKIKGALNSEGKKATGTITDYNKMKNAQNKSNSARMKVQRDTEKGVKNSLNSESAKAASNAKAHKDASNKVSKAAREQRDNVSKYARLQREAHTKESNKEINNVTGGWSRLKRAVQKVLDWIKGIFSFKSSKGSGTKGYAKGTPASGHPGGQAIVGEEGPELAYIPNYGTTIVGAKGPELLDLPRGTSVLPNKHTERLLKSYGFPGYAGGVGNFFDALTKGPKAVWETGVKKFGLSDNILPKWFVALSGSPMKYLESMAVGKIGNMLDKAIKSFGKYAGASADAAKTAITAALKIMKKPMSWLAPMMTIAKHESGFNPRAVNNWDINAKRGDPSVGLFQIIGSTFSRYALPGLGDRTNPVASAVAAIRYMDARYGGIWGHPGIRSMAHGGGYKPYAKGGIINKPHLGLVGEAGPEAIIPLSQEKRSRALELYAEAGKALGVVPYANGGISTIRYKIKWGDTLSELAVQYKTTVKELMAMNKQIKNANKIYAGDYLTIKTNAKTSTKKSSKPKYTASQADSKYESTTNYMSYMQGMNAKGYDTPTYQAWKLLSIKDYMKYASKEKQQDYNQKMAQALSDYSDVNEAYKRFKEAGWYGLSKDQKNSIWNGIKEKVAANAIQKITESTQKWLDTFTSGLTTANKKIEDWIALADSMKQKQEDAKKDAYVDNYVQSGMKKYGMVEEKTGSEAIQEQMDKIKQEMQERLNDNATIKYQNDSKEFDKRKAQLDKEQKKLQDKIKSVTSDAKKKGLTSSQYASVLKPLQEELDKLNAEEKALTEATATNNKVFKDNEAAVASLGEQYQKLQKEMEATKKQEEILDKIKSNVEEIFNWNASSLMTEKTDEFGNSVRDIEGTIRSVLDVQKAIDNITSDIYNNIDATVEKMVTDILTTELPDIGELFDAESDYSGISNGINDAIGKVKPTWDETLEYMSSSITDMFSTQDWQNTMEKWTENMAIALEGMEPLFKTFLSEFPETIAKIMSELPTLVDTAMQNLTVGVFNTVIEILNKLVATVNQIVPAGERIPLFEHMDYATPTYTQNNETTNNHETKTYEAGGTVKNVTYIVQTGVTLASESELKEFAMLIKEMIDEEEGRGQS